MLEMGHDRGIDRPWLRSPDMLSADPSLLDGLFLLVHKTRRMARLVKLLDDVMRLV